MQLGLGLMETDSILIKGKRERFLNVRQGVSKGFLDGNLFVEVYIDKRSYFVIEYLKQYAALKIIITSAMK